MMLNPEKIYKNQNSSIIKNSHNKGSSTFSNSSPISNNKNIPHEVPSKIITLLDFIKNKKKFVFHNSFDNNWTKDFLAQKEIALMTINLEDDIEEEKKGKKFKKYNTKIFDSGNNSLNGKNKRKIDKVMVDKKNNSEKNHHYHKIKSPSTKKIKKSKYINNCYSNKTNNIHSNLQNNTKNNIKSNKNSENTINGKKRFSIFEHHDSGKSEYLYKFIIENANETDDNFQKKFEKAIKEVETQAQNKIKDKNDKKIYIHNCPTSKLKKKENDKNNFESQEKKRGSIFIFSENSKKLMIKDSNIGESSIIGENDVIISHEKDTIKNNIKKNGHNEKKDVNLKFDEKSGNIELSKLNSLKSILNELV